MTTKAEKQQPALERRIRWFYGLLNRRDFDRCHQMIDPRVRDAPSSVTLFQYGNALQQFMDRFGPLKVLEIRLTLHLNEQNKLYAGRAFAVGRTVCSDKAGEQHIFLERWVRDGRAWYSRCTGFVTPETEQIAPTSTDREA
ncbi:MAG TPA: hypothetical protein VG013_27960 [Gemmataceae bacterium]|jgi:hypothetical protein|nr:hypothetical protein [Gemmataceae bacterium]